MMSPVMQGAVLGADGINIALNVGFGIIAAIMVFAALSVVMTRNVVHGALWLVVVLAGIAAQYLLAGAEFVAVSQVLVYIGAVMVLFLFGIMLTQAKIGADTQLNNPSWALGIPVAVLMLGVLVWAVIDAYGDTVIADVGPTATVEISDAFLGPYLLPFLAVSFVLLAAAVGAIVIARKD